MHVQTARAQHALYQELVALGVVDATGHKEHSEQRFTFIVDYGQNMELPIYNKEQPCSTHYYSPLSVYNLGVVNHVHTYKME